MAKGVFKTHAGLTPPKHQNQVPVASASRTYFRVDGRLPERIEDRMLPQLNGRVDGYFETNYGRNGSWLVSFPSRTSLTASEIESRLSSMSGNYYSVLPIPLDQLHNWRDVTESSVEGSAGPQWVGVDMAAATPAPEAYADTLNQMYSSFMHHMRVVKSRAFEQGIGPLVGPVVPTEPQKPNERWEYVPLTRPEKFGEAGWFNDRYAPELAKVSRRIALVGMCATEGDAKNITEADVQAWHDKKVTELTPGVTVSEAAAKEPTKPTKPPLAGFDTTASGDHRPGLWRQTEGA